MLMQPFTSSSSGGMNIHFCSEERGGEINRINFNISYRRKNRPTSWLSVHWRSLAKPKKISLLRVTIAKWYSMRFWRAQAYFFPISNYPVDSSGFQTHIRFAKGDISLIKALLKIRRILPWNSITELCLFQKIVDFTQIVSMTFIVSLNFTCK